MPKFQTLSMDQFSLVIALVAILVISIYLIGNNPNTGLAIQGVRTTGSTESDIHPPGEPICNGEFNEQGEFQIVCTDPQTGRRVPYSCGTNINWPHVNEDIHYGVSCPSDSQAHCDAAIADVRNISSQFCSTQTDCPIFVELGNNQRPSCFPTPSFYDDPPDVPKVKTLCAITFWGSCEPMIPNP
ncbi:MAG: hypothetical protein Q8P05_00715 [Candidatus Diapherotrites archaeon]|nr:hypothetical protein [Candidatus Diapherotrites archaeon]